MTLAKQKAILQANLEDLDQECRSCARRLEEVKEERAAVNSELERVIALMQDDGDQT